MTLSTIRIGDMHCANCVTKVEQALRHAPGVEASFVNAARRLVLIEHSPDTDPASLLRCIEDAGFEPSLSRVEADNARQRDLLKRLGVAGLGMMQVMMFAIALYAGAFDGMDEAYRRLLQFASLLFCIPVVFYSALPFYRSALAARRQGLGMDVPVAIAISMAFGVSLVHTITGDGEVYYDSVVMFTFLLLLARYVDDRLKTRFDDANGALAALPDSAQVLGSDGRLIATPLHEIGIGARVWVEQGNDVPLDGQVSSDEAVLDESVLTGESDWVRRKRGERVFAGTSNRGAGFELLVTAAATDSRVAAIAELAARSQADKPRVALFADAIARRFVPAVLLLAATTWLVWNLLDPERAFVAALTVLVVSCPCALSLATPAAITAAMTRLRQNGIVLTRSDALEQAARLDAAIVDKTGTLTVAEPERAGTDWLLPESARPLTDDDLLTAAAALERTASHPLARAFADVPVADPGSVSDVRLVAGAGVEGRYRGRTIRVGSAPFCHAESHDDRSRAVYVAVDGNPVARLRIREAPRRDAAAAIAGLRQAGLAVTMVSGDSPERCAALAGRLGIDYVAQQSPETKLAMTRDLQSRGHRVLAVGDGINDVPALAAADVAVAVLESSDLVKAQADVLLTSRRLGALVDLVSVSRRAVRVIRQNLLWALAYNLTAIPLAACGLMPPWVAALGMAGSSMLVMTNAARLLARTPARPHRPQTAGALAAEAWS